MPQSNLALIPGPTTYYFVDESAPSSGEGGPVSVGLVRLEEPAEVRRVLDKLRAELCSHPDLQLEPAAKALAHRHFHYVYDSVTLRDRVIDCIREMPFSAYIAFSRVGEINLDPAHGWFDSLFVAIARGRILEDRHRPIEIFIEEHGDNEKRQRKLQGLVESLWFAAQSTRTGASASPPRLKIVSKGEVCTILPDYVCGAFKQYSSSLSNQTWQLNQFHKLRERLRLVHDVARGYYYSREQLHVEGRIDFMAARTLLSGGE